MFLSGHDPAQKKTADSDNEISVKMLRKRDEKRLSFLCFTAHIFVLLKITEITELADQDQKHYDTKCNTDQRGVDRHAVIIDCILYLGRILRRKDRRHQDLRTEESQSRNTGADSIIREVANQRAEKPDHEICRKFQSVYGKKSA